MERDIVSSVSYLREMIRDSVREKEIDQFDADFLNEIIDNCETIYNDYNEEKISHEELEQRAKSHAQEIIFQYNKESGRTKSYLQDILENFDQDLLSVDIDLGTDIGAMTIKEAEEPMENRAFDQALELMDKFDEILFDYDEGVKDKETVAYKFNSLKSKVEQLKKECGVEDRTFLNEKMKQFEEILQYYNIPLDESKKMTEAEAHQFQVKDIELEGDELHISCHDTKYDEDFDKYLVACKKSIRLLMKDPAFDIPDQLVGKCKDLMNSLEESKKITESSQSPMIFKAGNVYRLTPNDSYAYDRVEILGIAWNDMVGQCTVQYKVIMKDGSVEEGQSEARDLISTIKKNNQDRVEFYKTEVPQMNESQTLTEATTYRSTLAQAIQDAVDECIQTGSLTLRNPSYPHSEVRVSWADNENDMDIHILSDRTVLHYTELGVADALGYN